MKRLSNILGMCLLLAVSSITSSAQITFARAGLIQGENLSASATFTILGGGQLGISLANTYTGDTPDQSAVLTGIFFNYSGAIDLMPVSASASAGSVIWTGATSSPPPGPSILGTEWAYGTGSAAGGANAGIVSSGYYTPGHGNFALPGDSLDGSAFGILSAGYAGSDLDGLGTRVFMQPSMDFVLGGFTGSLSDISHVSFQYGTSSSEPNLVAAPVPEPTMLALVGLAGLSLILFRCRRKYLGC